MEQRFSRTELVIGKAGLHILAQSSVTVFGIGGVGGAAVETLARSGIGTLTLVDHDTVSLSNINRQIVALETTLGKPKVEVMADRIKLINPDCRVRIRQEFYEPNGSERFFEESVDYVVDAIDSVASKVDLIAGCMGRGVPIVSAMGAGNKLDPCLLQVADISKTHSCPLARAVRTSLRKVGIDKGLKVVFSPERPQRAEKAPVPGSTAFVPPVAGMILASVVVRDILERGRGGNESV